MSKTKKFRELLEEMINIKYYQVTFWLRNLNEQCSCRNEIFVEGQYAFTACFRFKIVNISSKLYIYNN
jgi:hypothetical protein